MQRSIQLTLSILMAVALATPTTLAKKKTFEQTCNEILTTMQVFYPVQATEMGIHEHDFLLADYSANSVKSFLKKLNSHQKTLRNIKVANLSPNEQINHRLLKSNLDMAIHRLKHIKWHQRSPMLYVSEARDGIYFLLLSGHAPLNEKRVAIMSRMKAVPNLLATARKNLSQPPPIWIVAAQESLEATIQFYREVAGQLSSEFPEHADQIMKTATAAREAMNDFSIWLGEIEAGEEASFAIGKKDFDYMLSHQYLLDYDADSLLHIGEHLLLLAQQAYDEYQIYVDANHQNGTDSVFVPACFGKEDLLAYYRWESNQVRQWCQASGFVTIPENIADCGLVETPPFLRSMISGIAYQPAGPFDKVQQGIFYVRPLPDEMEPAQQRARYRYVHRRGFKGSVVHEAWPGHHLQMQLAGRNDDPVRKWQMNYMFLEGWALYCEEAVYEHGLFGDEDPARWLSVLGGIRFRAARIVADVKLHTGQFTYQECVDWMIAALDVTTESSKEYIRKEVRRYTMAPTVQMSYLMGKQEIMHLREAVQQRDGDQFSLLKFHDDLLAQGSIPPAMLWEIWGLN